MMCVACRVVCHGVCLDDDDHHLTHADLAHIYASIDQHHIETMINIAAHTIAAIAK
jgi:hypothetical protein